MLCAATDDELLTLILELDLLLLDALLIDLLELERELELGRELELEREVELTLKLKLELDLALELELDIELELESELELELAHSRLGFTPSSLTFLAKLPCVSATVKVMVVEA